MTDQLLLKRFVEQRDEAAFAELVGRHGGIVLATARRLARDDAEDVAQAVFLLLSQKAAALVKYQNLSGWLYETTRYCAANACRERRRRKMKMEAAREVAMSAMNKPGDNSVLLEQLDEGLSRLSKTYQQVLLIRYLEDLSVEETAGRLGLTAAAVMKRSTRGLSRLREFFNRKGITASAQGIVGCMLTQAVQLAADQRARMAAAGNGNAAGHAVALASTTHMSMTIAKVKLAGVIAALAVAGFVTVEAVRMAGATAGGNAPLANQPIKPSAATMQAGLAARTFNSKLSMDVWMLPEAEDGGPASFRQGTKRIGETPSAEPLKIPSCIVWWIAPVGIANAGAIIQEAQDQSIPGLDFGPTKVTDADLEHLKDLTGLQMLILDGRQVTDAGLENLKNLKALQILALSHAQVTDAGLKHLGDLKELQWLSLEGCARVTDAGLVNLKDLKKLRMLWLDSTQVTDAGLENLKDLKQLQSLDLRFANVTNSGLERLKDLKELRELDLAGTHVTDLGLEHLKNLNGLKTLNLGRTGVTAAGVAALKQVLPGCNIITN